MRRLASLLILFASIALSFLLYGNTLSGEFVWDDHFFAGRPALRDPGYLLDLWFEPLDVDVDSPGSYRPMLTFSAAVNFLLTGDSPFAFHLVNIVLNGAVTFFVYLVVFKLFFSRSLAILSALLFAFFPIHTEAVAQIKSRDELLAAVFLLLSWLVFLKGTEGASTKKHHLFIFASSILFLAAVFAKEFMIVAPALFLAVFWARKSPSLMAMIRAGLLFFPSVAFYFLMRHLALGEQVLGPRNIVYIKNPLFYSDWWVRIGTGFKAIFLYFLKTFVPDKLSATYAYNHFPLVVNPLISLPAIGAMIMLIVFFWCVVNKNLRKTPWTSGLFIFFIPTLLASNIVMLVTDLFAERWAYFPSIGLSLVGGYTLNLVYGRFRYYTFLFLVPVLIGYTAVIITRNEVWTSNELFYKHIVIDAPDSAHGRLMLAQYLASHGDFEAARPHIQRGLEIYRHPQLVELASILAFNDGDYTLSKQLAVEVLEELKPSKPRRAHLTYAIALAHEGEYQKSLDLVIRLLEKGKKLDRIEVRGSPLEVAFAEDSPAIRFILAVNLYKLGRIEEAKKYFDWDPHYSEAEKISIINKF